MVRQCGDCLINRSTGFDEDDNRSRPLERENKLAGAVLTGKREGAFTVGSIYGFIDFGGGAVVDGDREAFLSDV